MIALREPVTRISGGGLTTVGDFARRVRRFRRIPRLSEYQTIYAAMRGKIFRNIGPFFLLVRLAGGTYRLLRRFSPSTGPFPAFSLL